MPDRAPSDMRNAAAGKMGARPDAAMKSISEQLRSNFANVLTEPLPKRIMDVMAELGWGAAVGAPRARTVEIPPAPNLGGPSVFAHCGPLISKPLSPLLALALSRTRS